MLKSQLTQMHHSSTTHTMVQCLTDLIQTVIALQQLLHHLVEVVVPASVEVAVPSVVAEAAVFASLSQYKCKQ
ncbi:hypothetical protein NL431_28275, partial [Klebsiella pneumoniae]|nr:hypothetical protein [Klebsiella pneumoniae]